MSCTWLIAWRRTGQCDSSLRINIPEIYRNIPVTEACSNRSLHLDILLPLDTPTKTFRILPTFQLRIPPPMSLCYLYKIEYPFHLLLIAGYPFCLRSSATSDNKPCVKLWGGPGSHWWITPLLIQVQPPSHYVSQEESAVVNNLPINLLEERVMLGSSILLQTDNFSVYISNGMKLT